jgi:hypothetical protein
VRRGPSPAGCWRGTRRSREIASLWGQVGAERFSALVRTRFAPETHEPQTSELITPLYRHDKD